jgi:hypothetical protein
LVQAEVVALVMAQSEREGQGTKLVEMVRATQMDVAAAAAAHLLSPTTGRSSSPLAAAAVDTNRTRLAPQAPLAGKVMMEQTPLVLTLQAVAGDQIPTDRTQPALQVVQEALAVRHRPVPTAAVLELVVPEALPARRGTETMLQGTMAVRARVVQRTERRAQAGIVVVVATVLFHRTVRMVARLVPVAAEREARALQQEQVAPVR